MTETATPQDKYKIFDTEAFDGRYVLDGNFGVDNTGVVIFKRHFTFKDAMHMVFLFALLLLFLVFVILFAQSKTEVKKVSGEVQALKSASDIAAMQCKTHKCALQTGYIVSIMNETADPCDDFYEYACGNYHRSLDSVHYLVDSTVYRELQRKNRQKMYHLLISRKIGEPNFSYKVKQFFTSCYHYQTKHHRDSNPLITEVLNKSDSLAAYLFDKDISKVTLDDLLQTVNGKYQASSLFSISVYQNPYRKVERSPYSIYISNPTYGVGMMKFDAHYTNDTKETYRAFVLTIANMLLRDAKLGWSEEKFTTHATTFTNDIMEMESLLSDLYTNDYDFDDETSEHPPEHPESQKTLGSLTLDIGSFKWVNLLKSTFTSDYSISRSTKVVVSSYTHLKKLGSILSKIQRDKGINDYRRIISNYFTWRITSYFELDLSPEYRSLFQKLKEQMNPYSSSASTPFTFCYGSTKWAMRKALSSLFVRTHFGENGKKLVDKMFVQIKSEVKYLIQKVDWLSDKTKKQAIKSVDAIIEKSGYPDEAMSDSYMNREYSMMGVSSSNYFNNILQAINYLKASQTRLLYNTFDSSNMEYWGDLWGLQHQYKPEDSEILVQAGMMQPPLMSADLPRPLSYGAMGTILAHEILHSFDDYGRHYKNQKYMSETTGWWEKTELDDYNSKEKCLSDALNNASRSFLPEIFGSSEYTFSKLDRIVRKHMLFFVTETTGLKVALNSYRQSQLLPGYVHQTLPGLDLSEEQLFFLSFAQIGCYKKHPYREYFHFHFRQNLPFNIIQNAAIGQNSDFSKAFKCPTKSRMNEIKVCDLWY